MMIPTLPLLTTSPLCSFTKESAYLMDLIQLLNMIDKPYRVFYLVTELGWIDVDLRSSPGWQAAFLGKYCTAHRPSSTVKSKSTSPGSRPNETPCTHLLRTPWLRTPPPPAQCSLASRGRTLWDRHRPPPS